MPDTLPSSFVPVAETTEPQGILVQIGREEPRIWQDFICYAGADSGDERQWAAQVVAFADPPRLANPLSSRQLACGKLMGGKTGLPAVHLSLSVRGVVINELRTDTETIRQQIASLPRVADLASALRSSLERLSAAVVMPLSQPDETWTDAKNDRRCDLIDKEIDGTISPAEERELENLQREMLAYRRTVAPLPLDELRKLHQGMLRKAQDEK